MKWLDERKFDHYALEATMTDLLAEVKRAGERLQRLEQAIDHAVELLPESDQALIQGLQALRGVAKTTAVGVFAEIGRFSRFESAQLMAYTGLVPSEHSTGGPDKARRGRITKTGNSRVRWMLTESAWSYRHRPSVRGDIRKRQEACSEEVQAIAWKAQNRLYLRYRRLLVRKGGHRGLRLQRGDHRARQRPPGAARRRSVRGQVPTRHPRHQERHGHRSHQPGPAAQRLAQAEEVVRH